MPSLLGFRIPWNQLPPFSCLLLSFGTEMPTLFLSYHWILQAENLKSRAHGQKECFRMNNAYVLSTFSLKETLHFGLWTLCWEELRIWGYQVKWIYLWVRKTTSLWGPGMACCGLEFILKLHLYFKRIESIYLNIFDLCMSIILEMGKLSLEQWFSAFL